jgi:hypothetical protein
MKEQSGKKKSVQAMTRKKAVGRRKTRKKASRTTSSQRKTTSARTRARGRKWSKQAGETSNALDLEHSVFKLRSPRAIADSLKRSAEGSHRRKSSPFRSALSMLVFYINRAGRNLSAAQHEKLERAKGELRRLFGKDRRTVTSRRTRGGVSRVSPRRA